MWENIMLVLTWLDHNWFRLGILVWLFYLVSGLGRQWFKDQWEWFKLIFIDDDDENNDVRNAPSHKNAVVLGLSVLFGIAFIRSLALLKEAIIPDIPQNWLYVLLIGLGIAAVKSGAQKLFENKWGNGNSNVSAPPPKP